MLQITTDVWCQTSLSVWRYFLSVSKWHFEWVNKALCSYVLRSPVQVFKLVHCVHVYYVRTDGRRTVWRRSFWLQYVWWAAWPILVGWTKTVCSDRTATHCVCKLPLLKDIFENTDIFLLVSSVTVMSNLLIIVTCAGHFLSFNNNSVVTVYAETKRFSIWDRRNWRVITTSSVRFCLKTGQLGTTSPITVFYKLCLLHLYLLFFIPLYAEIRCQQHSVTYQSRVTVCFIFS